MPKYNRTFQLTLNDIDLIEGSLREKERSLSELQLSGVTMDGADEISESLRNIRDLLGRLHNQKVFYRPKQGAYVGG